MCRTQLTPSSPDITYHPYKSLLQQSIFQDENQQKICNRKKDENQPGKSRYENHQALQLEKQQNLPYHKMTLQRFEQTINTEQILNDDLQYHSKSDQGMNLIIPNTYKNESGEYSQYENYVQQNIINETNIESNQQEVNMNVQNPG